MIRGARLLAAISGVGLALAAPDARAGDMDPAPERLVIQPPGLPFPCQEAAANPERVLAAGDRLPNEFPCRPDNGAFRNLVGELGIAIAPPILRPARTTGFGGFVVSFDVAFTSIDAEGATGDGTRYWEQGTKGPRGSPRNTAPNSVLTVYTLRARKGLPFGFELGTAMGYLGGTSLFVLGGDLSWAILEGFRTGPLGYVPDFAVGGGVRTLVGSSKMYLTTLSIDVVASKPITLADSASLSPFVGYQRLITFGNSTIVDLTPNVDPLARCGYAGPDPITGAPVCRNKLSNGADDNSDLNNNATFSSVRIHRHRVLVGATYRYEIVHVAAQVATDLTSPSAESNGLAGARQWTVGLSGGVAF